MHRPIESKLDSFFFSSNLYDTLSLPQFINCFPANQRDNPELAKLHQQFCKHREDLKSTMRRDIQEFVTTFLDEEDMEEEERVLAEKETRLQRSVRELESEIEGSREELKAFAALLASTPVPQLQIIQQTPTPNLQELKLIWEGA